MHAEWVLSALSNDLFLSELNLAGTHDSATAFVAFEKHARCQSLPIAQQLMLGVRLLDIRLCRRGEAFYLVHSKANCFADAAKRERLTFERVLEDCRAFLEAHPRETLVMSVKQDRGFQTTAFFEKFYNRYIRPNAELWYTENRIPTLCACRGKIVLMRRCKRAKDFETEENCGLDFSVWADQSSPRETAPFTTALSGGLTATVQDCYRLEPQTKWAASTKPFLEACAPSKTQICMHFLSTCGGNGVPKDNADIVNPLFSAYNLKVDRPQGWFLLDFPTEALCEKIVRSNFVIYQNSEENGQGGAR